MLLTTFINGCKFIYTLTNIKIVLLKSTHCNIPGQYFPNHSKTTFDVRKTTSYVEKIMSDIIQTTSDLFRLM